MVNCLVVWNMNFIFPNSWDDDQSDELIFFRGVETTNQYFIESVAISGTD